MSDKHKDQIPYTEILRLLISGIVAFPQDVEVRDKLINGTHWITIRVHTSDHGKVVGSSGNTIRALQGLCEAVARNRSTNTEIEKIKLTMELPVVGDDSMRGLPFVEAVDWNRDSELEELVVKVITQITNQVEVEVEPYGQSSRITLSLKGRNPVWPFPLMADALGLLFKAWGRSQGRRIHFVAVG